MKPAVRQMRGPGMNKGLKKPRFAKFPSSGANAGTKSSTAKAGGAKSQTSNQSVGQSADRKDYKKGSSYLSKNIF